MSKSIGTEGCITLKDLPDEVISTILVNLDPRSLTSIAQTCHRLNNLSSDNVFWFIHLRHEYAVNVINRPCQTLLSAKQLYLKVMRPYGRLIGYWRLEVPYFGRLVKIEFKRNRIVAWELKAVQAPRVEVPGGMQNQENLIQQIQAINEQFGLQGMPIPGIFSAMENDGENDSMETDSEEEPFDFWEGDDSTGAADTATNNIPHAQGLSITTENNGTERISHQVSHNYSPLSHLSGSTSSLPPSASILDPEDVFTGSEHDFHIFAADLMTESWSANPTVRIENSRFFIKKRKLFRVWLHDFDSLESQVMETSCNQPAREHHSLCPVLECCRFGSLGSPSPHELSMEMSSGTINPGQPGAPIPDPKETIQFKLMCSRKCHQFRKYHLPLPDDYMDAVMTKMPVQFQVDLTLPNSAVKDEDGVGIGDQGIENTVMRSNMWTPDSSEDGWPKAGIWVGSYSAHGLEFILITYSESIQKPGSIQLTATKITGDPNIPSGKTTFKALLNISNKISRSAEELGLEFQNVKGLYHGQGQIAFRGFLNNQFIPVEIYFESETRLSVHWLQLGRISKFYYVGDKIDDSVEKLGMGSEAFVFR